MKRKRKAAEFETKKLNEENELLSKELKISKFEFSEIEKRYNQGKIQKLNEIIFYARCNNAFRSIFGF